MKKLPAVFVFAMITVSAFVPVNGLFGLPAVTVATAATPAAQYPAASLPPGSKPNLVTVTFPVGSLLIPMDGHQGDVIKAFGFIHALLRNTTMINRIIEPFPMAPYNITIKTLLSPSGSEFSGGPVLLLPAYKGIFDSIHTSFPSVTADTTTEQFTCNYVFVVGEPTKILLILGIWGQTEALLTDMGIPFDTTSQSSIMANPVQINSYNLVIDDCPGAYLMQSVRDIFTAFVENGNELIYTDQAIEDFKRMPWGDKMAKVDNTGGSVLATCNFHALPDFPGQYSGKTPVSIYQYALAKMGTDPVAPDVKIIADTQTYPTSPNHRIIACYFYYGPKNGIVEFFGYHPAEQTVGNTGDPDSYKLASFLYGNKFLHTPPVDFGVMSSSAVTPPKIALKDTGPKPSDEWAKVTLSLRPVGGADISPSNSLQLNYELMPYIDNVTGSFVDGSGNPCPPDTLTVYPNGSKYLQWNVQAIPAGWSWNVSFNVTSTREGKAYINNGKVCNATFYDFNMKFRVSYFLTISVQVQAGYPSVPEVMLPALPVCAAAIAAVVAVSRGKKRKAS